MSTFEHFRGELRPALRKVFRVHDPRLIARSLAFDLRYAARLDGPPFSPFKYAASLGLKIEYQPIQAEGVLVVNEQGPPRIILRGCERLLETNQRRRMNFTLAHEIGHFLFRKALDGHIPISLLARHKDDEELLCNAFAADLLMPRMIVRQDFAHVGLRPNSMLMLSERYDVSLQSILCCATSLYKDELVTAFWKSADRRLSVHWASPSPFRQMILCDTKRTTVERAFRSCAAEFGLDSIVLSGKRMRWYSTSQKLIGTSKVLTIMSRGHGSLVGVQVRAARERQLSLRPEIRVPVQQWLPFSGGRTKFP